MTIWFNKSHQSIETCSTIGITSKTMHCHEYSRSPANIITFNSEPKTIIQNEQLHIDITKQKCWRNTHVSLPCSFSPTTHQLWIELNAEIPKNPNNSDRWKQRANAETALAWSEHTSQKILWENSLEFWTRGNWQWWSPRWQGFPLMNISAIRVFSNPAPLFPLKRWTRHRNWYRCQDGHGRPTHERRLPHLNWNQKSRSHCTHWFIRAKSEETGWHRQHEGYNILFQQRHVDEVRTTNRQKATKLSYWTLCKSRFNFGERRCLPRNPVNNDLRRQCATKPKKNPFHITWTNDTTDATLLTHERYANKRALKHFKKGLSQANAEKCHNLDEFRMASWPNQLDEQRGVRDFSPSRCLSLPFEETAEKMFVVLRSWRYKIDHIRESRSNRGNLQRGNLYRRRQTMKFSLGTPSDSNSNQKYKRAHDSRIMSRRKIVMDRDRRRTCATSTWLRNEPSPVVHRSRNHLTLVLQPNSRHAFCNGATKSSLTSNALATSWMFCPCGKQFCTFNETNTRNVTQVRAWRNSKNFAKFHNSEKHLNCFLAWLQNLHSFPTRTPGSALTPQKAHAQRIASPMRRKHHFHMRERLQWHPPNTRWSRNLDPTFQIQAKWVKKHGGIKAALRLRMSSAMRNQLATIPLKPKMLKKRNWHQPSLELSRQKFSPSCSHFSQARKRIRITVDSACKCKTNLFPVSWCCILAKMSLSTRDTGDAILGPDLETGMTLRPNALPTNVPRWDAQSPRVARTAPLSSRCRTRGQNMELHKRYSTSASASHGTVEPKKRKIWSFFITSSSEPQTEQNHTNPDS